MPDKGTELPSNRELKVGKPSERTMRSVFPLMRRLPIDTRYRIRASALDIVLLFLGAQALSVLAGILWPSEFPYLSAANISTMLQAVPLLGVTALGVGILMIAGEFDLSVGANFVLSSIVTAMLVEFGLNAWLGAFIGVCIGATVGFANGLVTLWLKIPSFIATLGMTGIWAAATLFIHGAQAQPFEPGGTFAAMTSGELLGVPVVFLWLLAIATAAWALLQHFRFGGHLYAAGGNPAAATATGVAVRRTKLIAFVITGTLAATAGILAASRVSNVSPGGSVELPLQAIAACVIGGVALMGGRGTALGIVIGAAFLYWIQDVLLLLGAPGFYLSAFVGALVIVAATFYRIANQRQTA